MPQGSFLPVRRRRSRPILPGSTGARSSWRGAVAWAGLEATAPDPGNALCRWEVEVMETDVRGITSGAGDELQVDVMRAGHLGDIRRDRLPGRPAAGIPDRERADR